MTAASPHAAREFPPARGRTAPDVPLGTGLAKHHCCADCGIHVFTRPRASPRLYTVSMRCLDDFDLESAQFETVRFDGRHREELVHRLG